VQRLQAVLARVLAGAVAAGALLAIPTFPLTVSGSMRIAAVQPNTHAGYFDPKYDPAANLRKTVLATGPAVGRSADLVVWPEGAAMYDATRDPGLQQQLQIVAQGTGAPLLTGSITERGGRTYNSSLLWTSNAGITALYDKVRPVPFGEYVPDRAFWTPFAPDLLKLIGRDYTPGTRSSVIDVGRAQVGVDICFDVVDDGLILGSVADGAQILVAQTNNADFGHTDENVQQLAIARLRAIETGRALVSDSTVASTTAIGPDGRTLAAAKPFTTQTLVVDMPLATGITPAVSFGVPLGATIAILGGVLPLLLGLIARRPRRPR
jgi:apolipoprotein N-acyltransferase